jgi:hypothetical protein
MGESPAVSHASLVEAYLSGLQLTAVAVAGAGKQCRIITGEPASGEPIQYRYFFKPSHVDLLLSTIGQDGLSGKPAAALAELIEQAAAKLGARYQTASAVRKVAEAAVAEILERVQLANQKGGMKLINRQYKAYRLSQIEKGEKAIAYQKFIEPYIMSAVRGVASAAG